ncbi:hypothetical protein RJJ37_33015 [Rhizobium redzepovicii]|uniref:Uncharacterized protein n=1 Tax=Rhizobium redzepovicii TaxID=2867518 RepID=A0AAW8PBH2_9HYPH|nr:hypothetical protein [Rhizobium redzepovicii]MDR9764382.1 hypothetical protein [Rhizobium redzepovicii]
MSDHEHVCHVGILTYRFAIGSEAVGDDPVIAIDEPARKPGQPQMHNGYIEPNQSNRRVGELAECRRADGAAYRRAAAAAFTLDDFLAASRATRCD